MLPLDDILDAYALGRPVSRLKPVSSGLVNHVYSLTTTTGSYILKRIDLTNPRARNLTVYRGIETFKQQLADAGLPVILALRQHGDSIFTLDATSALIVFPMVEAKTICPPVGPMPVEACDIAGDILGRIHALALTDLPQTAAFSFDFSWDSDALSKLLNQVALDTASHKRILELNETCHAAEARLQRHAVYSHGDYFPHNLIFDDDMHAYVIDFEMAGLINPMTELVLASILFPGRIPGHDNPDPLLNSFIEGYRRHAAIQTDELEDGFWGAINKAWLNWIGYNLAYADHDVAVQTIDGLMTMMDQKDRIIDSIVS